MTRVVVEAGPWFPVGAEVGLYPADRRHPEGLAPLGEPIATGVVRSDVLVFDAPPVPGDSAIAERRRFVAHAVVDGKSRYVACGGRGG